MMSTLTLLSTINCCRQKTEPMVQNYRDFLNSGFHMHCINEKNSQGLAAKPAAIQGGYEAWYKEESELVWEMDNEVYDKSLRMCRAHE